MFRKNKDSKKRVLNQIEQKIEETKVASPCEAAVYTLLRASAKGWIPDNLETCDETLKEVSKLEKVEDIQKKFPKLFLRFSQCANTLAINQALHHFEEKSTREVFSKTAASIEFNNQSIQKILDDKNPLIQLYYKKSVMTNKEMAANLRFFSQMHIACLTRGSSQSLKKANAHLDEIKQVSMKMARK